MAIKIINIPVVVATGVIGASVIDNVFVTNAVSQLNRLVNIKALSVGVQNFITPNFELMNYGSAIKLVTDNVSLTNYFSDVLETGGSSDVFITVPQSGYIEIPSNTTSGIIINANASLKNNGLVAVSGNCVLFVNVFYEEV